jgi:drug/metabolite transporter (DMT)-like permease
MKSILPIALAVFVGFCNVPLIYGFRKAYSQNPFIFAGSFNLCSAFLFLSIAYIYGGIEHQYFIKNWALILFATLGIFIINFLAYYIINHHGASYWIIASLSSMLVPAIVVGYFIFKERVNLWIIPSVICAILSVIFFVLSKR